MLLVLNMQQLTQQEILRQLLELQIIDTIQKQNLTLDTSISVQVTLLKMVIPSQITTQQQLQLLLSMTGLLILLMTQVVLYQQQMKHLFLTLTLTLITGLELLYLLKLSAAALPPMDLEWRQLLTALSVTQQSPLLVQLIAQHIVLLME